MTLIDLAVWIFSVQKTDYSASQTRTHITAVSGKTQKLTAAVHKTESLGSAALTNTIIL